MGPSPTRDLQMCTAVAIEHKLLCMAPHPVKVAPLHRSAAEGEDVVHIHKEPDPTNAR